MNHFIVTLADGTAIDVEASRLDINRNGDLIAYEYHDSGLVLGMFPTTGISLPIRAWSAAHWKEWRAA